MEEFQPVLEFLKGQRNEALEEFRTLSMYDTNERIVVSLAVVQTKFKIFFSLLNLPEVIKLAAEQIEKHGQYKARFEASQEGGSI